MNRWYDHGTGEGGKLFDLAIRIYRTNDAKTVLQKLKESTPIFSSGEFVGMVTDNPAIFEAGIAKPSWPDLLTDVSFLLIETLSFIWAIFPNLSDKDLAESPVTCQSPLPLHLTV